MSAKMEPITTIAFVMHNVEMGRSEDSNNVMMTILTTTMVVRPIAPYSLPTIVQHSKVI